MKLMRGIPLTPHYLAHIALVQGGHRMTRRHVMHVLQTEAEPHIRILTVSIGRVGRAAMYG